MARPRALVCKIALCHIAKGRAAASVDFNAVKERPAPRSYLVLTDIHQIAAGSFANLPRFRVLGNPAPLARAVDEDGTSRRHAER